jgi:hypothetical protein
MHNLQIKPILLATALLLCATANGQHAPLPAADQELATQLQSLAPTASPEALAYAVATYTCIIQNMPTDVRQDRLAVIDYSLPSTAPRFWVFDLTNKRLLFAEWVAHGRNSGANFATRFSNAPGSYMSSAGMFVTANSYTGKNGVSLRLRGLEPGINDNAMARAIVIHGADYVNPAVASIQGRLGRSFGCPAVRKHIALALIASIENGTLLSIYSPHVDHHQQSWFLSRMCGQQLAEKTSR